MNPAANPIAVDPDEVLREHTRVLSGEYRARLADAFEDPREAGRRFYDEASRVGPAEAAMRMRDEPAAFGALKGGGEAAAREAAAIGARAYHSRVAEGEPRVAVAVLDQAIGDRLAAIGADEPRVRATWAAVADAYGAEEGARVFVRRAREVLGGSVSPADAEQVARLAAARDYIRARLGPDPARARARSAPLPRSLDDAAGDLPQGLRERRVAAADGFRKRLRGAYENPLAAEAHLHAMVDEQGAAAFQAVGRDPALLGALRGDLPGGADQARALAVSAIDYSALAYEYHHARGREAAERLQARDALADARLGARDAERAMEGVQEAVQLHGPALEAHLARQRERGVGRGGPGRSGPGLEGNGTRGGPEAGSGPAVERNGRGRETTRARRREARDGSETPGDPAVDAAVQAHRNVEEARELARRLRLLREERRKAEEKLAELREQDDALTRARRDLRAVAAEVYRDPDRAVRLWEEAVGTDGRRAAHERLRRDPAMLGPLRADQEPGRVQRVFQAAARAWRPSPGPEAGAAADPRSRLAARADAFARADEAVGATMEWTAPDGTRVVGRKEVRASAETVARERRRQIDAGEKRLVALGGVKGAERTAGRSLETLSPAQRRDAMRRIEKTTGASAIDVATGMARKAVDAVRVTRALGEGPAGL